MEISIMGWCFIVTAIIILVVVSNILGRRFLTPREKTEDGVLEEKDQVKEDDKSKTNEKEQLV